jgi:hypothetical protein
VKTILSIIGGIVVAVVIASVLTATTQHQPEASGCTSSACVGLGRLHARAPATATFASEPLEEDTSKGDKAVCRAVFSIHYGEVKVGTAEFTEALSNVLFVDAADDIQDAAGDAYWSFGAKQRRAFEDLRDLCKAR